MNYKIKSILIFFMIFNLNYNLIKTLQLNNGIFKSCTKNSKYFFTIAKNNKIKIISLALCAYIIYKLRKIEIVNLNTNNNIVKINRKKFTKNAENDKSLENNTALITLSGFTCIGINKEVEAYCSTIKNIFESIKSNNTFGLQNIGSIWHLLSDNAANRIINFFFKNDTIYNNYNNFYLTGLSNGAAKAAIIFGKLEQKKREKINYLILNSPYDKLENTKNPIVKIFSKFQFLNKIFSTTPIDTLKKGLLTNPPSKNEKNNTKIILTHVQNDELMTFTMIENYYNTFQKAGFKNIYVILTPNASHGEIPKYYLKNNIINNNNNKNFFVTTKLNSDSDSKIYQTFSELKNLANSNPEIF